MNVLGGITVQEAGRPAQQGVQADPGANLAAVAIGLESRGFQSGNDVDRFAPGAVNLPMDLDGLQHEIHRPAAEVLTIGLDGCGVVFDEPCRVGQVRLGNFAHRGVQLAHQLSHVGGSRLDALERLLARLDWAPLRGEFPHGLIGLVGQLVKLLKSFRSLVIPSARPQIRRRLDQGGMLREGLDKPIPRVPHPHEINRQPAVLILRAAGPARVIAQLEEQFLGVVEVPDLFLQEREFGSFLLLLGLHEDRFDLSPDLVELLGEANLPGRDIPQPAAVFARQRHPQNFGPQGLVLGKQKRHVVPLLRLDGPRVEEFRGQESPRLALARQTLDFVGGKRAHFGIGQRTEFPQAGADVAADRLDFCPGETVQRHDATVLQYGHPLPGRPIETAGRLGPQRGSTSQQAITAIEILRFISSRT